MIKETGVVVQMAANLAKKVAKVEFNVKLPYKITKRPKWFLASCPILDVHSQGDTEEIAKRNLVEALSLFLVSCFERGTLDKVLKKCGFSPIHRVPGSFKPISIVGRENYISVPIPFRVEPGTGCHV
jgi:predicted RNase H-like HicB family nuclease